VLFHSVKYQFNTNFIKNIQQTLAAPAGDSYTWTKRMAGLPGQTTENAEQVNIDSCFMISFDLSKIRTVDAGKETSCTRKRGLFTLQKSANG